MFVKKYIAMLLAIVLAFSSAPLAYAWDEIPGEGASGETILTSAAQVELENPDSYATGEILVVFDDDQALDEKCDSLAEELDEFADAVASLSGSRSSLQHFALGLQSADLNGSGTTENTSVEPLDNSDASEPVALVEFSEELTVAQALARAEADPRVIAAQPNYYFYPLEDEATGAEALEEEALGAESPETEALDGEAIASETGTGEPLEGEVGTSEASPSTDVSTSDTPSPVEPLYTVNDPKVKDNTQWWLSNIKAQQAWDVRRTNGDVTVAIIDTGARLTHDDLKANLAKDSNGRILAWDTQSGKYLEISGREGYGDDYGHGTHVAGLIAAVADNNILGVGSSFNAKILPVAISRPGSGGLCTTADMAKAYNYILSLPSSVNVRVINCSMGSYYTPGVNDVLRVAVQKAAQKNILTVAAAGNGNDAVSPTSYTDLCYPSDFGEVLSVVAVDKYNERAYFSNYNQHKDIAAPGANIYSTWNSSDRGWKAGSGTSMSCPIVAGTAALLFAENPSLTADEAWQILCGTASDLGTPGRDDYYGYGLLNAEAAVNAARSAHENVVRYTVTFNAQGGSVSPASKTYMPDSPLGVPPVPEWQGHRFLGWFTAAGTGGAQVSQSTIVTGNATYYAHWETVVSPSLTQYSGSDRFDTAVQASRNSYPDASRVDTIIIACGTEFADALAASSLAGAVGGPLLLAAAGTLDATTLAEIYRLSPRTIYLVGGESAVSNGIYQGLENLSFRPSLVRLGGSDRFETAYLIANERLRIAGKPSTVFVTNGYSFADALSVGSLSACYGVPILPTTAGELSSYARRFIEDNRITDVVVIGGTSVVSDNTLNQIHGLNTYPSVSRWFGPDRYATALDVVSKSLAKWKVQPSSVGIATGEQFPDALVGGAAMGNRNGILVISPPTTLSDAAGNALTSCLQRNALNEVTVFGGTRSIDVMTNVKQLVSSYPG
ncbi:MAG: S8 family serine peptidase [Coriobacteriales bacterium]|jgi:subtilisin family serine protease/putative cell wall-binding protein|nr:S8 family serine peptidase [Coriobacteriales bacterium]